MAVTSRPTTAIVSPQSPQAWIPTPAGGIPESILLQYLPGIYSQDPFLRRLLLIFESVLAPLERVVNTLPLYTEPEMAPEEFLPWLAHWVAVSLDSAWPLERQRALIAHAVEIYRWRGTRQGLKLHIATYTGTEALIQEHNQGFVLGPESRLGWTTGLVAAPRNPLLFVVTVPVPDPRSIDPAVLRAIIEEDKPAHTTYYLRVVRGEAPPYPTPHPTPHAGGAPTGGVSK